MNRLTTRVPRILIDWTIIAVFATIAVFVLSLTAFGQSIDNLIYDRVMPWRAQPPDDRIIIIAIDNHSLQELGKWPWPRHFHTQLIDNLLSAQPKAIGYDILFTEPSEEDPALANAVKNAGNVFLPILLDQAGSEATPVLPVKDIRTAARALGQVNVHFDSDNLVRRADLMFRAGNFDWPHLTALMTHSASAMRSMPIAFQPESGSFRTISFVDAMRGQVPAIFFRDKLVLVGTTADGMGDDFSVPLRHGGKMAGVELMANELNTQLSGFPIRIASPWLVAALSLLPIWLSLYGFWFWRPKTTMLIGAMMCIMVILGTTGLFYVTGFWVGPMAALIGLIIIYPVWGWRRLAALSASIESEIETPSLQKGSGIRPDVVGRQQGIIAEASRQEKALRANIAEREDVLQALSHDMRAPQAGIIMLLENEANALPVSLAARLTGLARRTMALADNFVQLARVNETQFAPQEINLCELVNEVIDDVYPLSAARKIHVVGDGLENPCYIMAEPGLLMRALLNLLDNAIKYSPDGGQIDCSVFDDGQSIRCIICDYGVGMSDEQLKSLFSRFDSIGGARRAGSSGSGLGLALVKSVIERHGGTINCMSSLGNGTRFTMKFPVADITD